MTISLMALLAGIAGLAAALLSWLILRWSISPASPLASVERYRKAEGQFIPRIGGLAIGCGFAVSSLITVLVAPDSFDPSPFIPCFLTIGLMFGLGLLDDFYPLGAKVKLLAQLAIALSAYAMGLRAELLTGFSGNSVALNETVAILTTAAWLIAIPNIVNLIDGIDGLAGGLAVFAATTLAIVMISSGQVVPGTFALILAASCLGFLVFNFPPAKIYMGDGGAYGIGSVIATLSLQSSQKGSIAAIFLVVMIALGLPILDTALAIFRRGLRGVPLFRGDAKHIHHRLLDLGHSARSTVIALYGLCLLLSVAGLVVFWTHGLALPIVTAALFVGSVSLARYLGMGANWGDLRQQVGQAAQWRKMVRRSHRSGEYLLSELAHCRDAREFWQLFDSAAERLGFLADGQARGSTAVVSVQTQGNPALCLRYPKDLEHAHNWWGMADCLYPAFAAAMLRWAKAESHAINSENLDWNYSTTVVLSA